MSGMKTDFLNNPYFNIGLTLGENRKRVLFEFQMQPFY